MTGRPPPRTGRAAYLQRRTTLGLISALACAMLFLPPGPPASAAAAHSAARPASAERWADHFTMLSSGQYGVCGVRTDASLTCWGGDWAPTSGRYRAVNVGIFTCALGLDGAIRCWGGGGEDWAPSGRFARLGAGPLDCAVRVGGSVVCWTWPGSEFRHLWTHEGRFTSVSGGTAVGNQDAACAITQSGSLVCWGVYRHHAPTGIFRQVSVGAGYDYSESGQLVEFACALRTSGTLVCWGYDYDGTTKPPSGMFVDVSAGNTFVCGVRSDGAVVCWGHTSDSYQAPFRPPATRFTAVSAGQYFACGLRPDGTPLCWGGDAYAQTVVPSAPFRQAALSVAQGSGGLGPYCGLRTDGSLVCWGMPPVPVFSGRFREISMDSFGWFCALRASGAIDCGGYPGEPQLPTPPPGRFTQIGVAVAVVCGVRRTTEAIVCSSDSFGSQPFRPPGGRFRDVAVGDGGSYVFGCGLRVTGTVGCWGDPTGGVGEADGQTNPPGGRFKQVVAGPYAACGLRPHGSAVCWGEAAGAPMPGRFVDLSIGLGVVCGVRPGGKIYCDNQQSTDGWVTDPDRFVQVAAGHDDETATDDICGVAADGSLDCWGDDGVSIPAAQPQVRSGPARGNRRRKHRSQ